MESETWESAVKCDHCKIYFYFIGLVMEGLVMNDAVTNCHITALYPLVGKCDLTQSGSSLY